MHEGDDLGLAERWRLAIALSLVLRCRRGQTVRMAMRADGFALRWKHCVAARTLEWEVGCPSLGGSVGSIDL